jgi:hypothetical protein
MSINLGSYISTLNTKTRKLLIDLLQREFSDQLQDDLGQVIDLLDYGDTINAWGLLDTLTSHQIILFEKTVLEWDQINEPNFNWV